MPRDPADLSPAIEALLRRFELVLRGVIVRFRMSRPDADELIQDVRIRVWKLLESGTLGFLDGAISYADLQRRFGS